MIHAEYTDEQIEVLADLVPELLKTLAQIRDTPPAPFSTDRLTHANRTIEVMRELAEVMFNKLDGYCWHIPSCTTDEMCYGDEPNEAQKAEAEKQRKSDDEARREDFEP